MIERDTGLTFQLGDVTWHCWVVDGGRYEWRSSCQRFRAWREGYQVLASCDGHPAQTQRNLRAAMVFAQSEGLLRDCGFRSGSASIRTTREAMPSAAANIMRLAMGACEADADTSSPTAMKPYLEGVLAENVDLYWPHIRAWVAASVRDSASAHKAEDIYREIAQRRMQLWVIWAANCRITGVIVTEVYDTAAGMTCALPVAGGEMMQESLPVLKIIEKWAKEQGCVRLRGEGRAGWERALKPLGWRKITTQMEKLLT